MTDSQYLRMEAEQSPGATALTPTDDKNAGYIDHIRRRPPSDADTYKVKPMMQVHTVNETSTDESGEALKQPEDRNHRKKPRRGSSKDRSLGDKPAAGAKGNSNNNNESDNSYDGDDEQAEPVAKDPFIPKRPHPNPAQKGRAVEMRRKKPGCKSNESMTSDASSGFHSDCTEDHPPPAYSLVMMQGAEDISV